MNTYTFQCKDDFFPSVFEGEIQAVNKRIAKQQLSHLYSQELGTAPKTLTITIEKGDVVNE